MRPRDCGALLHLGRGACIVEVVRLCAAPLFASMRICLLGWCSGEDAAGDGDGLFPHIGGVGVGAGVAQFLRGVMENAQAWRPARADGPMGLVPPRAHRWASIGDFSAWPMGCDTASARRWLRFLRPG